MVVHDVLGVRLCQASMSETARRRNDDVIGVEIERFDSTSHERKAKLLPSTGYPIRSLRHGSDRMNLVTGENGTYLLLVVYERIDMGVGVQAHQFLQYVLRSSELDEHFMDNGYFHALWVNNRGKRWRDTALCHKTSPIDINKKSETYVDSYVWRKTFMTSTAV